MQSSTHVRLCFDVFRLSSALCGGLLGLFTMFCGSNALAQGSNGLDAVYGEGTDVLMTDAARFHLTLHSQGAGFGVQRGTFQGAFLERGWQGELVFVRHPKEEKTRNPVYEESLPYIYGKVNAHHALRIERYTTRVITEKYRQHGVTVARTRQWGVVLGLAKPVYLEIGYPDIPYTSVAVERYDPEVHFSDRIYGRAPWVNGLEDIGFNPGLGWGEGFSFEFNDQRSKTRTLEVGLRTDVYLKRAEIMAAEFVESRRIHFTFCLRYGWGAQWSAKGLSEALR